MGEELLCRILYNPLDAASTRMRPPLLRADMVEPGPTILRSTEDPLDLHALMQSLLSPEATVTCVLTGTIGLREDARHEVTTRRDPKTGFFKLAENEMQVVADEIRSRWPIITGVGIVQRVGSLETGMQVLMIACTTTQPHEAVWEAAEYGMSRLGPSLRVDRSLVESGRSESDAVDGGRG